MRSEQFCYGGVYGPLAVSTDDGGDDTHGMATYVKKTKNLSGLLLAQNPTTVPNLLLSRTENRNQTEQPTHKMQQ